MYGRNVGRAESELKNTVLAKKSKWREVTRDFNNVKMQVLVFWVEKQMAEDKQEINIQLL